MVREVGQTQNVKGRAEKNGEQSCDRRINRAGAIKEVVDGLMNKSPQWIVQGGNWDKSEAPPHTPRQKIERKDEQLKNIHKNVQSRKTEIDTIGYT